MLKLLIATSIIGMAATTMTASADSMQKLVASPQSGSAPLVVTFTGEGSGQFEGFMALDFGDGEVDPSISTIRGFTRTHTYGAAGTYTAELKSGPYGGEKPSALATVGSVTIVVK